MRGAAGGAARRERRGQGRSAPGRAHVVWARARHRGVCARGHAGRPGGGGLRGDVHARTLAQARTHTHTPPCRHPLVHSRTHARAHTHAQVDKNRLASLLALASTHDALQDYGAAAARASQAGRPRVPWHGSHIHTHTHTHTHTPLHSTRPQALELQPRSVAARLRRARALAMRGEYEVCRWSGQRWCRRSCRMGCASWRLLPPPW
jgi:hypothetical protein